MTTVTSTERPSTLSERLDPRNWSLVTKLVVVGLVPTVLALSIGALRVIDQANVAEELGRGSGLVDVHRQLDTLAGTLQAERNAAAVFVGAGRQGDRAPVDAAQAATDDALRTASEQLDAAQEQEPQLGTARAQAETTLGQLPDIRSQVAAGPVPVPEVTNRYTSVIQRTLGLDRALVSTLQTADTAGLTNAIAAGTEAREALELERAVVDGAIASGGLDEAQRAQLVGADASFQAAAGDYVSSLPPEQVVAYGDFTATAVNAERDALRDQVLGAPAGSPPPVDPAVWNAAVDRSVQAVDSSTQAAEQAFVDGRAAAAADAGNTAGLNSVLLMLTLLLTGGIILLLGRQMVRSLRLLRSSALEVAERKLPAAVQSMRAGQAPNALVEPVPLDSRDEIGEVARAFDAVHGQAIRLASDQAALQQNVNSMFVNLSRRSQALVERQLQLIEQLESNEQDPDQLSNLFQLDHLATRMRRNSENLLVLAGTDLAKRNVAPVQVVDVLRAAVSEVEQYQRVVVQTPPNATIAGRAANDLVHLLAELLDNATNFSPPDSQVVMTTTRTADESLLVEISDRGVGMTDSELADANQRLSGPAEVDVSASRRMGLFVVGRLAARHRVGVRLVGGAAGGAGGLSASVTIPTQLVPSAPLPEQRRDDGRDGGRPSLPTPPPADLPPGLPEPEPAGAPAGSGGPAAVNGAGRGGSLPSLVAGSDGPLTPTFESGHTVTPGARNGSATALPTRKPGSSLRREPDTGDAPGEQGTAANGSAPDGFQAFAPSTESGAGASAPAPDRTGDGPSGRGAGTAEALGLAGAAAAGAASRSGSDTGSGRTGPPPERDLDDTVVIGAIGDDDPPPSGDSDAAPQGAPQDGDDDRDVSALASPTGATGSETATEPDDDRSGIAGAALGGAAALAGAAALGRSGRTDRTAADDAPGTEQGGAAGSGDGSTGPAAGASEHADGSAAGAPGSDGPTGPGSDGTAGPDTADTAAPATDDPAGPATGDTAGPGTGDTATRDPAGPAAGDTAAPAIGGTAGDDGTGPGLFGEGSADGAAAPVVAAATSVGPTEDVARTGDDAPRDSGAGDEATGTDVPTTGSGADRTGDVRDTDVRDTDDRDTDTPDTGTPGDAPGTGTGGVRDTETDTDTAADTETAAIPTIRPSGREPMGGPPSARTNGSRPGPAPRPVMPGHRDGSRGSVPLRRTGPGPQGPGLPQRAPGRTGSGPAAPQGPGSNGSPAPGDAVRPNALAGPDGNVPPEPGGSADALPKRQARPPRGPAGGPEAAGGPGQDELFAPKVPVAGDRGQLRRPGAVESARGHGTEFDMGQTTPIFDDIASAWFRSNRSVPVRWQDGAGPQGGGPAAAPAEQPARTTDAALGADDDADGGFASPADEVWQQAREVADDDAEARADDLTGAGLPKRRPRARLLPGSAAGSTVLSPAPAGEPRSAESVRGRLASYQQGVRQGRESASGSRRTTDTGGTPEPSGDRPNSSDPEEHQ